MRHGSHPIVPAAGVAALLLAAVGLAPPAAAQLPDGHERITYTAEVAFALPCFGSPTDIPPGPMSLESAGSHAWSPDGLLVAAQVYRPEPGAGAQVVVVDVEDCSVVVLGPADDRSSISWSPDGARLALARGGDVVVVSAATGATVQQVTSTAFTERDVTWSPQGDVVAFAGEGGVRTAPVDGSDPDGSLLVAGAAFPAYSPDGGRIAYTRPGPMGSVLAHADAGDGGGEVALPDELVADHIAWSPDGSALVLAGSLMGGEDEGPDCYVTSLDGSSVTALGVQPMPCTRPAWRPVPYDGTAPDLTLVYLYRKVDPGRAPSWGNSGPQVLLDVVPGHHWLRRSTPLPVELPAEVCGPGWAIQTDRVVGLDRGDVPPVIDRATGTGVLGWGRVVRGARHHSLEYYVQVPACGPTS